MVCTLGQVGRRGLANKHFPLHQTVLLDAGICTSDAFTAKGEKARCIMSCRALPYKSNVRVGWRVAPWDRRMRCRCGATVRQGGSFKRRWSKLLANVSLMLEPWTNMFRLGGELLAVVPLGPLVLDCSARLIGTWTQFWSATSGCEINGRIP